MGRVLEIYFYNVLIFTNDWCKDEKGEDIIFSKNSLPRRWLLIFIGGQENSTLKLARGVERVYYIII